MQQKVLSVLDQFRETILERLPPNKKSTTIDLVSNPSFYLAAFFLTATRPEHNIKVDKQKLTQQANCNMATFNSVYEEMREMLYPEEVAKEEEEKKAAANKPKSTPKKNTVPRKKKSTPAEKRKFDDLENEEPDNSSTIVEQLEESVKQEGNKKKKLKQQKLSDFF